MLFTVLCTLMTFVLLVINDLSHPEGALPPGIAAATPWTVMNCQLHVRQGVHLRLLMSGRQVCN